MIERKKWQERRVADEALWASSKHCRKIQLESLFQRGKTGGGGSTLDFYTFEYHTVSIHQHFSNVHYQHLSKEHMLFKKKTKGK